MSFDHSNRIYSRKLDELLGVEFYYTCAENIVKTRFLIFVVYISHLIQGRRRMKGPDINYANNEDSNTATVATNQSTRPDQGVSTIVKFVNIHSCIC